MVGLSARQLAEGARRSGFEVIAADLFGDEDTVAVARGHHACGRPEALAIEADLLLPLLAQAARDGRCAGWVAGSGFEGRLDLLAAAAERLPLWGNDPATVAAVRDPVRFFAGLAALGLRHPEVRLQRPAGPGWLQKDLGGSGGWHIRRCDGVGGSSIGPQGYFQRESPGAPISAVFLANGRTARLVGISAQIVRPLGGRPYVYRGCIGPLAVPPRVAAALAGMADGLAAHFGLRGVNGVDCLLEGDDLSVLELNPRPVASMALFDDGIEGGLVRAHVRAATTGELPGSGRPAQQRTVRGHEIVFARRGGALDAQACTALAGLGWCHDRPRAGYRYEWGDPLCSVSASGADVDSVRGLLRQRRATIRTLTEQ